MHEASVARALITQVTQLAEQHSAVEIETVNVQVGEFSGVEPALLASAFAQLVPGSELSRAQLEIERVSLLVRCTSCRHSFHPEGYRFLCPKCGSLDVEITAGDALLLKHVTFQLASEEPACP